MRAIVKQDLQAARQHDFVERALVLVCYLLQQLGRETALDPEFLELL